VKAEEMGRKTLVPIISMVINSVVGFIGLLFLGWYLFPYQTGTVQFAIAFIGIFSIIGDLGFGTTHLKKASEVDRDLGKAIGTYATVKLILTVAMMGLILGSMFVWKTVLGNGFETPDHEYSIYIILFHQMFTNLSGIGILTFQARTHVVKMQLPTVVGGMFQLIAVIYVTVVTKETLHYALCFVVGSGISFVLSAILLLRGYSMQKPSRADLKEYSVFALPLMFAGLLWYMSTNIDKVMLQFFGGAEFVGLYFYAYRWASLEVLLASALGVLVLPHLSSLHSQNKIDKMSSFNLGVERYVSLFTAPVMTYFVVMAFPFIDIVTQGNYSDASSILVIMAVFTYIAALNNPWSATLTGSGKPELHFKINLVVLGLIVGLNALFIPPSILGVKTLGLWAEGAALATLLAILGQSILQRYYSKKIIGVAWNPRIVVHLGASVCMGLVLFIMRYLYEVTRFYELVLFGLVGLGVYVGILMAIKEFTRDEIILFTRVINPTKMKDYVKDEMKGSEKIKGTNPTGKSATGTKKK